MGDVESLVQERLMQLRPLDGDRNPDNPGLMTMVEPGIWISGDDNVAVVRVEIGQKPSFLAFWRDESVMGYKGTDTWRSCGLNFPTYEEAYGTITTRWSMVYW